MLVSVGQAGSGFPCGGGVVSPSVVVYVTVSVFSTILSVVEVTVTSSVVVEVTVNSSVVVESSVIIDVETWTSYTVE